MPVIPFSEWVPDAADFGNPGAPLIKNALPGTTSYEPLQSLLTVTGALDTRPRGAIEAIDENQNVFQYAGDTSKLYSLAGDVWTDVSLGGGYTTAALERWEFARFKEKVIATNYSDNPQSITFGGSNFANLTTALKFRHVGVVRDFVVAGNTFDSVDGIVRDRVWWSAQGDETDWSPDPVTFSDFRDLAVGGGIQAIIGGEYGVIVSERSTFRMTFVGSPTIFQIDEVLPGIGALAPGSVVRLGDTVFFPSEHGFIALRGGSSEQFIGAGRVDKTFLNDLDTDYLDRVSAVADPTSGRVFWAYPGSGNTSGRPNKLIAYDRVRDKWGNAEEELELIWRSGGTATTLEALDDLNLGVDLTTNGDFATDTDWTKGTGWTIAAGVATHAAGSAGDLEQPITIFQDRYYRVIFDVTGRTAGSVTPDLGGANGTAIVADDTDIRESIRAAATADVRFEATSDFDGSIDNVSVKEIDHLDSMALSLDSAEFKGSAPLLGAFGPAYMSGNFTGTPYPGTFQTQESELNEGYRTRLDEFVPLVEAGTVTARVGMRNMLTETVQYSASLTLRPTGRFTPRENANYMRFELTVTGDWLHAIGVSINRQGARKAERRG